MSGFTGDSISNAFKIGLIISHLVDCSNKMKVDCIANNNPLINHEDKITNRLVGKYLQAKDKCFHYIAQAPENFDENTDGFTGRVDIKVITLNRYKDATLSSYTIECKRIDGTVRLNRKYVEEGVARFTDFPAKYPLQENLGIMFGYVVLPINITDNAIEIEKLQHSILKDVSVGPLNLLKSENSEYYVYDCSYNSEHLGHIQLGHLFYDLSGAMECSNA
jgi:hypothetical protein